MKQRFYFDTSVFGGVYDVEFERETLLLFDEVASGQIVCVYSDLTEDELKNAPEKVRTFFENLPDSQKEKVAVTPELYGLPKHTSMKKWSEKQVLTIVFILQQPLCIKLTCLSVGTSSIL
jgi:hypothetical protein